MRIGPHKVAEETFEFTVWAPRVESMTLEILDPARAGKGIAMAPLERGYFRSVVEGIGNGARYRFLLDGKTARPDPASHLQSEDVHSPSTLVDHDLFPWTDSCFRPVPLSHYIVYELHVGTFTPEGTFDGVLSRLDHLVDLGVTVLELMPVAQFPGDRNWGYDGVYPFAVQAGYGGPEGLKRLVDACHGRGLSVILDVVYNHLGPEGNYLRDFGPYFTDHYRTPWGEAVNFDGPDSDEVRNYFLQNAESWFSRYHLDGLRLDATHSIFDQTPEPFLRKLAFSARRFTEESGLPKVLIAESNLNDPRLVLPPAVHGYGLDAVWSDDFHHVVHTLLTGEDQGYYADYGRFTQLVEVLEQGFAFTGGYSPFRRRSHGSRTDTLPGSAFVFCIQNHDQIGNRMNGERLSVLLGFEELKLAAGLLLLAPALPMLFMGEEYAEDNPFLYFISHLDQDLVEAVRRGRSEEFREFNWNAEPPDPQAPETLARSRLDWTKVEKGRHATMLALYRELIILRGSYSALRFPDRERTRVLPFLKERVVALLREGDTEQLLCLFNLGKADAFPGGAGFPPPGEWKLLLDSADLRFGGPGGTVPERLSATPRIRARSFTIHLRQEGE
jgi:maltooligosyltrehalose trehalohydrolase